MAMGFIVKEIWRYPVKSMRGEQLKACVVTSVGIVHDRGWAIRDEKTQTIRGAKHLPKLMLCAARFIEGTSAGVVPHVVEITLPDGATVRSDDPAVHAAISDVLGREVTIWPLQPADNSEHYRIKDPASKDLIGEWRRIFTLEPGEQMPDLSGFGPRLINELSAYAAPIGTYFDVFPINVLTEASLRHLKALVPSAELDVRRFRPNFLLANDDCEGLVEHEWVGRHLRVGTSGLNVVSKAPRCVMTSHAQSGLERDPAVIRTIVRELRSCFSSYAEVASPGWVSVGDGALVMENDHNSAEAHSAKNRM